MKRFVKISLSLFLILAVLAGGTSLASCSNDKLNRTVVGTVNGYEVYYEELRWMTMQYKDLMAASYGADIWDKKGNSGKIPRGA